MSKGSKLSRHSRTEKAKTQVTTYKALGRRIINKIKKILKHFKKTKEHDLQAKEALNRVSKLRGVK